MAEEERKPIKPVVKINSEDVKKKSIGRQFISSLITSDMGIIGEHLGDIFISAVQDTAIDVGCTFITMLFGGGSNRTASRRWNSSYNGWNNQSKTNYGTIYRTNDTGYFKTGTEKKSYEEPSWSRRSSMDYMDIPFNTRPDAEKVLDAMRDILDQYPSVSVADFYDLVGYNYGNNYTCNDYGWTDLSNVTVTWSRGAWYIALPRAIVIR